MIYQTNSFEKEFRNAYMQQNLSRKRQLSLGAFLGLITFGIYFCLQTLSKSVLIDAVPYIMMSSYFSTLYIYLHVSLLFNAVLFIANYEYMSYVEVMRNRWYPLVELGYRPMRLIVTKLIVRIVSQVYIYSVGFVTTIFVSSFLKFPFVFTYIISLYIVGLLDVVLLCVVSLAASLFFRNTVNARYVVGMIGVGIFVGKIATGFSKIVSDRARMSTVQNLFNVGESVYLITAAVLITLCVFTCFFRGRQLARVYNRPFLRDLPALTRQTEGTVVIKGFLKKRKKLDARAIEASTGAVQGKSPFNLPTFVTTVVLIASIAAMLVVNVIVLACGYASPEKESSIMGYIPYVFQSSTMEPAIMLNDLAIFRKVDMTERIDAGEIVLFKDINGDVQVARIQEYLVNEEGLTLINEMAVDIDNYIDSRYAGMARQNVNRAQIYGVFNQSERWLGALILFASTTLGRILLLLIPTFLVFFYDPITKFFRSISSEREQSSLPTVPVKETKDADKPKKEKK